MQQKNISNSINSQLQNHRVPNTDDKLSKFSPEIVSKIKESITNECSYINAIWCSKLIHKQKMVMLYLCGVVDGWTTVSEISNATSLPVIETQKTLKKLIRIGYINSDEFSIDLDYDSYFTLCLSQRIIDEYLAKLIRDFRMLKRGVS